MTMELEKLAKSGHRMAAACLDAFNPDQPRDEKGMWTAGGGSGATGSRERIEFHTAAAAKHSELAAKHIGTREENLHREAALAHNQAAREHLRLPPKAGNIRQLDAVWASERATKVSEIAHGGAAKAPAPEIKVERMAGSMPSDWKPGVGYRPGLNDPKPKPTNDKRDELTTVNFRGGGKGVTVTTAGALARQEKPSTLRTTQVEMPAVKEAPVAVMAPHSQLPVGNTKPKEPIHDLKTTQKLPAVREAYMPTIAETGRDPRSVARAEQRELDHSRAVERERNSRNPVYANSVRANTEKARGRAKEQTQEDRIRISANSRAKGNSVKAERFVEKGLQEQAFSKANFLSAQAAQQRARGDHAGAAKTYEEARAHYVKAGKDKIAANMQWNKLEAEGKAKKR